MSIVMKTIIELFDREPIENVLGMLMMNPQQVVFLGDKKIMREYRKESILRFAKQRGLRPKSLFIIMTVRTTKILWTPIKGWFRQTRPVPLRLPEEKKFLC